ncbi:MAG: DnaJ domain-containing protein [Actinomycetota bacterium]|nr:DnaJ domain-containing protein [Actinomycetota bacterium]
MPRDYYDVLGVGRDADATAIKRAYRLRARQFHPDVSADPRAADRFHEVAEAYSVLGDEEARRLYDRLGWHGRGPLTPPRGRAARAYASDPHAVLADLESLFAAAVGSRASTERARVIGEVELDPYEARIGATRTIRVLDASPCDGCGGGGTRARATESHDGRFLALVPCHDCGGRGEITAERDVQVTVPPGVGDGDRIGIGADTVALVRIVRPQDRLVLRLAASAALLVAVAFMLFLLSL